MSKRIKVGVVGLRHGMASVLELLHQDEFELVALCSRTSETYEYLCGNTVPAGLDSVTFTEPRAVLIQKARELQDFSRVAFFTDYRQFLARPDITAVIIAVPIRANAPFAIQALECGKHVLASKPFALTFDEGCRLREAALAARTKFMLNFEFRYSPLVRAIQEQLATDAIGSLRLLWWNAFRMPFRAAYRQRTASGGPIIAELCHWLDLFHHFNGGQPFERVCAFAGVDVLGQQQDIEDNGVCIIEYANRVRASLNFTYFTDQPQHNLFGLVGDHGKITADTDGAGAYTLFAGADRQPHRVTIDPGQAHVGHLGFDVAHHEFARAILEDRDINRPETEAGFENLLVTLAAQQSITSGRVVTRDEVEAGGNWLSVS